MMPVTLPPGWLKLATRPDRTGSPPISKTIGIVAVAALATKVAGVSAGVHCNSASNQFGYQFRQPVELILGPAIFDRDVPALSKPRFAQTLSERAHQVRRIVRSRTLEKRHYWHRVLLLGTRGERPCNGCTTNDFNEIAASHCSPKAQDHANSLPITAGISA